MEKYDTEIEQQMQTFFENLSEKDKRHYAAIEAKKLGHGGQLYMGEVLGCSTKTIQRGQAEIKAGKETGQGRIRRPGGGRKPFDKKKKS